MEDEREMYTYMIPDELSTGTLSHPPSPSPPTRHVKKTSWKQWKWREKILSEKTYSYRKKVQSEKV